MDCNAIMSNIKHDWYQTDSHVILNILLKKMTPENVRVDITEDTVTCSAKLPNSSECCLSLNLSNKVNPQQSSWKIIPSKIEIKLSKVEAIRWSTLKLGDTHTVGCSAATIYPSSKLQKIDWDKLANEINREEAEEKLEGDAALNKMFQKIYCEGSDETRKAMNKSFVESGGTVLSTNWKDVHDKKIEIKPPDGMEWKKWEN